MIQAASPPPPSLLDIRPLNKQTKIFVRLPFPRLSFHTYIYWLMISFAQGPEGDQGAVRLAVRHKQNKQTIYSLCHCLKSESVKQMKVFRGSTSFKKSAITIFNISNVSTVE